MKQKPLPKDALQAINRAAHAQMQAMYPQIKAALIERVQEALNAGSDWREVLGEGPCATRR